MAGITPPVVLVFKSDAMMLVMAKLEVVAFVPVAFVKVKFCRVVEPVVRRLPSASTEKMVEVATPSVVGD